MRAIVERLGSVRAGARRGALALRTAFVLGAALILPASEAAAMCNVIPAATAEFRAALGGANRPFAGPGETVEVRVRPGICDDASTGFVDVDGDSDLEDDYVVTVLFVPPAGPANATVLAESCTGIDLASCDAQLTGTVQCVEVNGAGEPVGLDVLSANELQFLFPDTDAALAPDGDDHTFSGPAKVVVSRRSAALPCGLATQRCAALGGTTLTNGVAACVDEIFALDGTCRKGSSHLRKTFSHFTALPPPSDYAALVSQPAITELRLTTDLDGHVLIPLDFSGVLIRDTEVPVPIPRLARLETTVDAFSGTAGAVSLPGDGVIASYSPEGIVL